MRRRPNEKTASEEGDRFAFSICFAGSTGERGSQAILTSLSSLLIALGSLFVEIAQAIKAILQMFTPLPCRMPGDFPRDKAAPTEMRWASVIQRPRDTRNYSGGWYRLGRPRFEQYAKLRACLRCSAVVRSKRKCSGSKLNRSSCAEAGDATAIAAVRAEKRSVFGSAAVFINVLPSLREHQIRGFRLPDLCAGFNPEQIQNCGG